MSTVFLALFDLAILLSFLIAIAHLVNRKLRPHCIDELRRFSWLAKRLLLYHEPLSNEHALMDEFAATCDELIAHHEDYSLGALCCRGWYRHCRELEARACRLYGAYQTIAGDPRRIAERDDDLED